jgi:membrane protease YdiL (CAAX protease family)
MQKSASTTRWFFFGCGIELALLALAVALNALASRPALVGLRWNFAGSVAGAVAAVPMLVAFVWMYRSSAKPFAGIRRVLERFVVPLFRQWSVAQLAAISALAGICEEMLFRGVLQDGLATTIGIVPALIFASATFGAFHLITPAYGMIASAIGIYLGLLLIVTGNLLAPIVAHAVYDFVALAYLVRQKSTADKRHDAHLQ